MEVVGIAPVSIRAQSVIYVFVKKRNVISIDLATRVSTHKHGDGVFASWGLY